jgi:TetR/AcrR family transcriptional regulator, cholesterol catabolism regulator
MAEETAPKVSTSRDERRDRRFQRQRNEIMDAAARKFADQGYAATTIKEIADAAYMGESTLYGYFPAKRDILEAIMAHETEGMDALLVQFGKIDDRDSFVDLLDRIMERFFTHLPYTRTAVAEAWVSDEILKDFVLSRARQVSSLISTFISEKVQTGIFRPIDADIATRILLGTFFGMMLPVLRGVELPPDPVKRRSLAETFVWVLLDGVAVVRKD